MKGRFLLAGVLMVGLALRLSAGNPQRIGHATLLPRHSNPDDGGLYNAFIDPAGGYAYFLGNYLWKLDITGELPVPVGPATNTGSSSFAAIDPGAGYAYISRITTLYRYSLGAGTNPITSAGSLILNSGSSIGAVAVDDSDPDPARHNAYVFCRVAGNPTRVAKVALGTLTELGYTSLNPGETNQGSCLADAARGYVYLATTAAGATNAEIVKIRMPSGTNLPVRVAAVNLGLTGEVTRAQCGELTGLHARVVEEMERELFTRAIELAGGNQARAARWLGVTRTTMREKLMRFGLHHPGGRPEASGPSTQPALR